MHETDNSSPFFSVVITTYNRVNLLKRALNSLFQQTEMDWEAIIIDDGSEDGTSKMVEELQKLHPAIHYFYQPNKGSYQAKNEGMNRSKGKFITFLDSDDEYAPNHLWSRKEILTEDLKIRFLHGGVQVIGEEYVPDRFDNQKDIHLSACAISGTFVIENQLAQEIGGFRKMSVGMDGDYLERVEEQHVKIEKTMIPTYIYHHETEDSITNRVKRNRDKK